MQDLNGLKPERLDAVEDPLAGAEQDRRDVQRELVDDPGNEGLAHSRGAARDVYAALPGRLARLCVSGVEAAGDEVEGRPAFHLDRLVSVMGEHKHRRVVRRLGTPPAAPVLIPLAADRPEHVPPHDVRAARAHEPVGRRRVGVVGALVAEMPGMELAPTLTEWTIAALVGPSDETVERDRHVAGGVRHRTPLGVSLRLASGDSTPGTAAQPPYCEAAWAGDAWVSREGAASSIPLGTVAHRFGTRICARAPLWKRSSSTTSSFRCSSSSANGLRPVPIAIGTVVSWYSSMRPRRVIDLAKSGPPWTRTVPSSSRAFSSAISAPRSPPKISAGPHSAFSRV